jgi:hypothetical protein
VTLENLGIETRAAQAPFQSAVLVAKNAGADGNAITVSVDSSGLTDAPTDFALQEELREGANEYLGDQWNFGAVAINPDGTIPQNAPRIRFGIDPQVYRPFKRYTAGRWVYSFTPAPVRTVPAGASVKAVSGSRTITITDQVVTETFSGIVTLFDALSAIRDTSALVRVEGAIVSDFQPGGQGITDLSVYTQSYAASRTADGTEYAREAEFPIDVAATAPTETLTIRCTDATESGRERWTVRGQVSGRLQDAITDALYSSGAYGFRIPLVPSPIIPTVSAIDAKLDANRGSPSQRPTLCTPSVISSKRSSTSSTDPSSSTVTALTRRTAIFAPVTRAASLRVSRRSVTLPLPKLSCPERPDTAPSVTLGLAYSTRPRRTPCAAVLPPPLVCTTALACASSSSASRSS